MNDFQDGHVMTIKLHLNPSVVCYMYTYHFYLSVCFNELSTRKVNTHCICIHVPPHLIRNIPCHGPVPVTFEVSVFVDFLLLLLFYRQSLLDALFCVIQHHSKPSPRILIVTSITEHFLM